MDTDAINHTSFLIIHSAIQIHKTIGPGLLESAYRMCMIHELRERGLTVESERIIPVRYKGLTLDGGYRIDLLVQDEVIVAGKSLGLLITFNVPRLADGVKRIANKFGTRAF